MSVEVNELPVVKAETDVEILDALHGVKMMQEAISNAVLGGQKTPIMALAFMKAYYDKLPDAVALRLTEIDRRAVERIHEAMELQLSGERLKEFTDRIASFAAFAQVVRAANAYRDRLGYAPLGADGWPDRQEGA